MKHTALSTIKTTVVFGEPNENDGMLSGVAKTNQAMADLLAWIKKEHGLSYDAISQGSNGLLSRSVITEMKEKDANPAWDSIRGLARGGKVSISDVVKALQGKDVVNTPEFQTEQLRQILREFEALPENARRELKRPISDLARNIRELLEEPKGR